MHDLTHAASITETLATDIVMNACKGNPERKQYSTPGKQPSYTVTFRLAHPTNEEREAIVTDKNGFVVAVATVDKFDN